MVTFPFLFGVMYGDIGHGFLLLMMGLALIFVADKDFMMKSDMKTLRNFRYILTMMGFFSFFIGFLYNDFMSIPL
jgi:V-type H+-transporting ATPase subunit a